MHACNDIGSGSCKLSRVVAMDVHTYVVIEHRWMTFQKLKYQVMHQHGSTYTEILAMWEQLVMTQETRFNEGFFECSVPVFVEIRQV